MICPSQPTDSMTGCLLISGVPLPMRSLGILIIPSLSQLIRKNISKPLNKKPLQFYFRQIAAAVK
jgi:hypothetical protein